MNNTVNTLLYKLRKLNPLILTEREETKIRYFPPKSPLTSVLNKNFSIYSKYQYGKNYLIFFGKQRVLSGLSRICFGNRRKISGNYSQEALLPLGIPKVWMKSSLSNCKWGLSLSAKAISKDKNGLVDFKQFPVIFNSAAVWTFST